MVERLQIYIPSLERWWTVANPDVIDAMSAEDISEPGEEIGGRGVRKRAAIGLVDVSVFDSLSGTQPALGNDVRRCILRGPGDIFARDHALALHKFKVTMDNAGGVVRT